MPSVISKYLDDTFYKYNLPREKISRSIAAGAFIIYGLKISYPYLQKIYKNSTQKNSVINNNVDKPLANNNLPDIKSGELDKSTGVQVVNTGKIKGRQHRVNKEFVRQVSKAKVLILSFYILSTLAPLHKT